MSKTIQSPIKRWSGSVVIADPLTIPQPQLIEAGMTPEPEPEALTQAREKYKDLLDRLGGEDKETEAARIEFSNQLEKNRVWSSVLDAKRIPAIVACVEKWELQKFPEKVTAQNFPASPRKDSHLLVEWLFKELLDVYSGEKEIPNE